MPGTTPTVGLPTMLDGDRLNTVAERIRALATALDPRLPAAIHEEYLTNSRTNSATNTSLVDWTYTRQTADQVGPTGRVQLPGGGVVRVLNPTTRAEVWQAAVGFQLSGINAGRGFVALHNAGNTVALARTPLQSEDFASTVLTFRVPAGGNAEVLPALFTNAGGLTSQGRIKLTRLSIV